MAEIPIERAERIRRTFQIAEEVFLLGSLEKGVTVYGQQVRAHNLMWALSCLDKEHKRDVREIAVVGGGIAGLTAAACALSLFERARVTIFERNVDLCSLQQGCDTRWIHPRIYQWPELGSRAPSASLPVLNWTEGRASDVADEILRGFAGYIARSRTKGNDLLQIYLGVDYLRISAAKRSVEWIGRCGVPDGQFVRAGTALGLERTFDRIVLAVGFGMEDSDSRYHTPSYWRNEKLAQPRLVGTADTYVVSGYGDGALVDLCRLTVERFRQDRILYDLFAAGIESTEEAFRSATKAVDKNTNIFAMLQELEPKQLAGAVDGMSKRIRKDTKVVLHLRGRYGMNNALTCAFGGSSSFANRLLLYLLYRCGAFVPRFGALDDAVREHGTPPDNVVCRYGPRSKANLLSILNDESIVTDSINRIEVDQAQGMRREWLPGSIPSVTG